MRTSLFISADTLMHMETDGRLELDGRQFVLKDEGRRFDMAPAASFLSVLSGKDEAGLVGRVLALSEIAARGGEHYQDSVLLGDVAYQVDEGFLGLPAAGVMPDMDRRADGGQAATAGPVGEAQNTGELLKDGLLAGLSDLDD